MLAQADQSDPDQGMTRRQFFCGEALLDSGFSGPCLLNLGRRHFRCGLIRPTRWRVLQYGLGAELIKRNWRGFQFINCVFMPRLYRVSLSF